MQTTQPQSVPSPVVKPINPKTIAPRARVRKKDLPLEDQVHTTTLSTRVANILGVILPFAGLATAIFLLWGIAFNWVHLGIMAGMYIVSGLGITVGYHRFFTHKSFSTSRPVAFLLGVFGSMAMQGSIIEWAAVHRSHHQHSDDEGDPHSPHASRGTWAGVLGVVRGFWHAHAGWLFKRKSAGMGRYVRDLDKDKMIKTVSVLFPLWVLIGLLLPAALGGLLTMTWSGVLLGFLWGGLVRIFLVHHVQQFLCFLSRQVTQHICGFVRFHLLEDIGHLLVVQLTDDKVAHVRFEFVEGFPGGFGIDRIKHRADALDRNIF